MTDSPTATPLPAVDPEVFGARGVRQAGLRVELDVVAHILDREDRLERFRLGPSCSQPSSTTLNCSKRTVGTVISTLLLGHGEVGLFGHCAASWPSGWPRFTVVAACAQTTSNSGAE